MIRRFEAAVFAVLFGALPIYAQREAAKATARNPFSGNQQAVAEGREIYNNSCTGCHGYEGTGGDRAPGLGASGRRYLRTSDQELFDAITKGIPGTSMPPTGLPETNAWKVAAYILSLRGTAIDAPAAGDVAHGDQIYWGKGGCSECHMLRGRGGLAGPDLSNVAGRRKLYSIRDALTKAEHRVDTDGGRNEIGL